MRGHYCKYQNGAKPYRCIPRPLRWFMPQLLHIQPFFSSRSDLQYRDWVVPHPLHFRAASFFWLSGTGKAKVEDALCHARYARDPVICVLIRFVLLSFVTAFLIPEGVLQT